CSTAATTGVIGGRRYDKVATSDQGRHARRALCLNVALLGRSTALPPAIAIYALPFREGGADRSISRRVYRRIDAAPGFPNDARSAVVEEGAGISRRRCNPAHEGAYDARGSIARPLLASADTNSYPWRE
ncbi:MAG: hypothetical protein J2P54_16150, partial [Bradyrhizobiaceae bacterium]|nr:hypothetical protein [Bradyrhizobiaceae bacterium]